MNIYVGNVSHSATEDDLRKAFEAYGQITSVKIVKDRYNGEQRGYGFVEMPDREEAISAIKGLNNNELKGQPLNVIRARRGGGVSRGGNRRF